MMEADDRVHYLINYLGTLNDLYENYDTESINESIKRTTNEIENLLIEKNKKI